MDTEKTKGDPAPPAITSFSPARSRTSSVQKWIADGLTVDDCSKGAAEVAHMISFMALLAPTCRPPNPMPPRDKPVG